MKVYVLHALTAEQIVDAAASARSQIPSAASATKKSRPATRFSSASRSSRMATRAPPTTRSKRWSSALQPERGRPPRPLARRVLEDVLQKKLLPYDKSGEEHFNLISALHKSVRNSDPDAALYWLARMLESGEDPLYLARRMVRMASEDIGLAEPGALAVTLAAKEAFEFLGPPEGNLALAQAAVYLSLAPKSNALYTGYGAVQEDLQEHHRGTRSAASKKCGHRT